VTRQEKNKKDYFSLVTRYSSLKEQLTTDNWLRTARYGQPATSDWQSATGTDKRI